MLFDLRGRGRRRTVRVIYIGLALLIGVGLVGFGVGGGFGGGGLLSAATNAENGGSSSYSKQIAKYRKLTKKNPSDASAWANLTKNLLHEAGGEAYVTSAGTLTSKGHKIFQETAQAWAGYIALKPPKPNIELTKEMLRVYGVEGLNEPNEEVALLELIVASEPTNASYYSALSEYAYKAHNYRLGDLSAAKAIALVPANETKLVKVRLAEFKKSIEKESKPAGSATTGATGATRTTTIQGPEGVITATTPSLTTKSKK